MPQRLLIRLHADGRSTWLAQGADGRALAGATAGLPPAQAAAQATGVVVFVPASEVLLLETAVVSKSRAQLVKAVPYALEDQIAQPVEDMHFALAPKVDGGRIGVAAVAHARLKAWLATLAEAGLHPDAIVPEVLALPVGGLLIEPAKAELRLAPWRAASIDVDFLGDWLEFANDGSLPDIDVYDTRIAPPLALPVKPRAYHERQRDPLALLASGMPGEPALNLLQGDYAPRHRSAPVARLWRMAAMLAGLALVFAFAQAWAERYALARQSDRLDAAMRGILLEHFPEMEKVAGEPAALMKSALARLGGADATGGAMHVLGRVAPIIGSTTRVTTRGLEFRNGVLELSVTAPDVPTLDTIRERLTTVPGLKVEVTAANPGANGVDGRLRVTGGAP
jgi:general secretion pathway protein L